MDEKPKPAMRTRNPNKDYGNAPKIGTKRVATEDIGAKGQKIKVIDMSGRINAKDLGQGVHLLRKASPGGIHLIHPPRFMYEKDTCRSFFDDVRDMCACVMQYKLLLQE